MKECSTDVLVMGTGLAGLTASLILAEKGHSVIAVTKDKLEISNSCVAQGGIASVMNLRGDSFRKHAEDTIKCGHYLNDEKVVNYFVSEGPEMIKYYQNIGTHFSRLESGGLDLGKEGGHSRRRIIHSGDITGSEMVNSLKKAVMANSSISVLENHTAVDIITTKKFKLAEQNHAIGAYVLSDKGKILTITAKAVLISTGGCGRVYIYSSNRNVTSGDGIAIGMRAGISTENMEMVQFHPTILYHEKETSFLISEALRGEGAVLKTLDGKTFMERYHSLKSLAPRDIVARAIDFELKKRGDDHVLLDATNLDEDFLKKRFPNIYRTCLKSGIDITKDCIPVVPAAHYTCGGLKSSPDGKTSVQGVFTAGEVAHTGFHGANRLASNSLLESAVMAKKVSEKIDNYVKVKSSKFSTVKVPEWDASGFSDSDEAVIIKQNWEEIRRVMWNYVGIVRSDKRLDRALKRIHLIKREINDYYWNFKITRDLLELRNLTLVAEVIVRSAQARKESRGLHYNIDYPDEYHEAQNTRVFPDEVI